MTTIGLFTIIAAYLLGSVPSGYLVIKILTGKDLTQVGSGRTGGTNALRAGGMHAFLLTGILDILKGALAIWLAHWMLSGQIAQPSPWPWVEAAVGAAVVIGHNWSLYLGFRGGAGTGPNVGVAVALCPPLALVLPPFVPLVLFGTGYASVASLLTAALIPCLLTFGARYGGLPWAYVGYGAATCGIVAWSLRPNLARLMAGTERRISVGSIRAKLQGQV
jgi:acyl phosphate:glycerol-3-phosphate acyltransferase